MEFKKGYYYYGIWFAPISFLDGEGDIMGMLYREGKKGDSGNEWTLEFRTRWYKDGRVFFGDDTKKWFKVNLSGKTQEEAVKRLPEALVQMPGTGKLDLFLIDGDEKKALKLIMDEKKRPEWMHVQTMKPVPEEAHNPKKK